MAVLSRSAPHLGVLIDPLTDRAFALGRPPEHAYPHLGPFFRRLGYGVVYFPPGGIDLATGRVRAWRYSPHGWERGEFPLPRATYNRISQRQLEASPAAGKLLRRLKARGLLFNPGYLRKDAALRALAAAGVPTPRFAPAHTPDDVLQALAAWNAVYLKPAEGSLGRGIVFIETARPRGGPSRFDVAANGPPGSPPARARLSSAALVPFLARRLRREAYIVQEAVPLARLEGGIADLRVLVQRTAGGWSLTGAAGRLARAEHVTTHTVRGGRSIPLAAVKEAAGLDERDVAALARRAAEAVERAFGPGYFEFSSDVAVSPCGALSVLEINAKPFPFDEEEIRTLAALRLLDHALAGSRGTAPAPRQ